MWRRPEMATWRSSPTALGLRTPRAFARRGAAGRAARFVALPARARRLRAAAVAMIATAFSAAQNQLGRMELWPQGWTARTCRRPGATASAAACSTRWSMEVAGLILQIAVSSLAAYALARKKFPRRAPGAAADPVDDDAARGDHRDPAVPGPREVPQPFTGGSLLDSYGGLIVPVVGWAFPIHVLTEFMKRSRSSSRRRPASTAPATCGSSGRWSCRCAGRRSASARSSAS